MTITYTIEPHKTAASVLEDKEYSIGLWANAMRDNRLHEVPAFIAWIGYYNTGVHFRSWEAARDKYNKLTSIKR